MREPITAVEIVAARFEGLCLWVERYSRNRFGMAGRREQEPSLEPVELATSRFPVARRAGPGPSPTGTRPEGISDCGTYER